MKKNRLKQKQHHDWYRKAKMNLTGLLDTFTDSEKAVMVDAWSFYYNRISLGMLPFTNRSKMRVAVAEYFCQQNVAMTLYDGESPINLETRLLQKLRL